MRRLLMSLSLLAVLALLAAGMFVSTTAAVTPPVIYRNMPNPVPGNVSSQAFEAQTVAEFGDRIDFEPSTPRVLNSVDVLMSSWGCESGSWVSNDCSTTAGATFSHPITLNIYDVGPSNSVGSLLGTVTQTFAIPYRPSKDDTNCTGGDAGKWFDGSTCFNGFATSISFDLTGLGLTAPNEVIMSVAYNTTHYGYAPIGESAACYSESGGCGYDSLNVGLSTVPANVDKGSNPAPNDAYLYATVGGSGTGYCANTNLNTFRLDSGCWGGLKPAFTVYANPVCSTVCYVDTATGNDSNGGTSLSDAKETIQGGIDAVDTGGTVLVNDGTYTESPDVTKSLTLQSINGRSVTTIQLQTSPTYLGSLIHRGSRRDRGWLHDLGRDGTDSTIAASDILVKNNLDNVVIKNNKLEVGLSDDDSSTGDDGFGIVTYYNTTPAQFTASLTVTGNIFEPLNSTGTRAFYINPGVNLFTFKNNTINGDFFGRAWTGAANGLVENNTVTGAGTSGGLGATGYPNASSFGQTTFSANTISRCRGRHLSQWCECGDRSLITSSPARQRVSTSSTRTASPASIQAPST